MTPYDVQLELTGCEASAPGTVTHLLVQHTVLDNIIAPILELQAIFFRIFSKSQVYRHGPSVTYADYKMTVFLFRRKI